MSAAILGDEIDEAGHELVEVHEHGSLVGREPDVVAGDRGRLDRQVAHVPARVVGELGERPEEIDEQRVETGRIGQRLLRFDQYGVEPLDDARQQHRRKTAPGVEPGGADRPDTVVSSDAGRRELVEEPFAIELVQRLGRCRVVDAAQVPPAGEPLQRVRDFAVLHAEHVTGNLGRAKLQPESFFGVDQGVEHRNVQRRLLSDRIGEDQQARSPRAASTSPSASVESSALRP